MNNSFITPAPGIDARIWHGEDTPGYYFIPYIFSLSRMQLCVSLALSNAASLTDAAQQEDR